MRILTLVAGLLVCGGQTWAQERDIMRLDQGSVSVTVTSPFGELPPGGYVPVTVKVKNGSRAPFDHICATNASSSYYRGRAESFASHVPILVQPGEERSFQFVAPLGNINDHGYGSSSMQLSFVSQGGMMSGSRNGNFQFTVATEKALGNRITDIQNQVRGSSGYGNLDMIYIRLDQIPEDVRAWFGVGEFWITAGEWGQLRPGQQLALKDWVTRGGRIVVWSNYVDRGMVSDLLGAGGRDYQADPEVQVRLGFGDFLFQATPGDTDAMVKRAVAYLQGHTEFAQGQGRSGADRGKLALLGAPYRDWGFYDLLPKLKVNVPMIILFIVGFTVVVGPVNLFVFSKASNRYRMFWITPLLSLGASLLLWVIIVFIDGFGAMGNRSLLVYVNGQENRASFFQEQVVRAGVLTNRSFSIPGQPVVQPLSFTSNEKGESYNIANGVYSGSWFASRAISGIYLESSDAFRGKVEVMNRDAFEGSSGSVAPEVVSSLPVSLNTLEIVDHRGKVWRGRNLKTGQRTALEPVSDGGFLVKKEALDTLGPVGKANLNMLTGRPRMFFASANEPGAFIETLPGIRWDNQSTIFAGSLD